MSPRPRAFTLVELLVVITIIIVLLALLIPALDQAVYQAELAACGANQSAIGDAVFSYALDHKRRYPYRRIAEVVTKVPPSKIADGNVPNDLRRVIAGYMPVNKMLIDPLCGRVELETDAGFAEQVFCSYNLWFGWVIGGEKGMRRLGDRFTYNGESFSCLASDIDVMSFDNFVQTSHPDGEGQLISWTTKYQGPRAGGVTLDAPGFAITTSLWLRNGAAQRGRLDNNVLSDDGSVARYGGVISHTSGKPDKRMSAVSWVADRSTETTQLTYIPKN